GGRGSGAARRPPGPAAAPNAPPRSELPDQADLGLQLVTELAAHRLLREVHEPADLGRGGAAQVDDDVGVLVEDPRAAVDVALEAALIDEPARADALDLLEDRARARVEPQVGVPLVAPGEVLAHHGAELLDRLGLEPEGGGEHDVLALVQHRVVVAELHVLGADDAALTLLGEQLARLEDLGDEARALAVGRRREEVQVLPDRPAHGTGDADVVVQPAEPALDARDDQVREDDLAARRPHPVVLAELHAAGLVADDQAAEPAVAHEDVGAEAEDEVRDLQLASGEDRV